MRPTYVPKFVTGEDLSANKRHSFKTVKKRNAELKRREKRTKTAGVRKATGYKLHDFLPFLSFLLLGLLLRSATIVMHTHAHTFYARAKYNKKKGKIRFK